MDLIVRDLVAMGSKVLSYIDDFGRVVTPEQYFDLCATIARLGRPARSTQLCTGQIIVFA